MTPLSFGDFIIKACLRQDEREAVYQAFDPALQQPVLLKLFSATSAQWPEPLPRLHHPYIARIYKTGIAEGRLFLALEDVGNETLAVRLAQYQAAQAVR